MQHRVAHAGGDSVTATGHKSYDVSEATLMLRLGEAFARSPLASAVMSEALTAGDGTAVGFDELQRKLVPLWQSMKSMSQDEQTIVVVPSMTLDDPGWPRLRSPGVRGALPLPATAPAPAARPARVRDLAGREPECHRLLPRPAPRRHPLTRAPPAVSGLPARRVGCAAVREAARAAAPARSDPRARHRPEPGAPRPFQHDRARARPCARSRHPDVRRRPALLPSRNEDGLPTAVRRAGRPPPARRRGPDGDRRGHRGAGATARGPARDGARDREAERGRVRARGTRASTCAACPRPGRRGRPTRSRSACGR